MIIRALSHRPIGTIESVVVAIIASQPGGGGAENFEEMPDLIGWGAGWRCSIDRSIDDRSMLHCSDVPTLFIKKSNYVKMHGESWPFLVVDPFVDFIRFD